MRNFIGATRAVLAISVLTMAVLTTAALPAGAEVVRVAAKGGTPAGWAQSSAVRAGDIIYVSGLLPVDGAGTIVGKDARAQTRHVLQTADRVLKAAGGKLAAAAAATVYVGDAADVPAVVAEIGRAWPKDPPAVMLLLAGAPLPAARVQVTLVGLRAGAERVVVAPAGWKKPAGSSSWGVRSGAMLWTAGLLPRQTDGTPVTGDVKAQATATLERLGELLAAGGATRKDAVAARVFVARADLFADMNAGYRPFFTVDPPARATVVSKPVLASDLVQMAFVVVKSPEREVVKAQPAATPPTLGKAGTAPGAPALPLPYSPGIRVGDTLWVAGTVGSKGDIGAQTGQSLSAMYHTVKAAGFDWPQVVDGLAYLTSGGDADGLDARWRQTFPSQFPARTATVTGLVIPDPVVEIMLTLVK